MRAQIERLWDYFRSKKKKRPLPIARLGVEQLEVRCVPANASGVVSGIAFIDGNSNGTFDSGEAVIPGVVVTLSGHTTAQNTPVTVTATSDNTGAFNFLNVLPGTYSLKAGPVAALLDSNATIGGIDASPGVTIIAGQTLTNNVGFQTGLNAGVLSVASFLTINGDSPFGPGGSGAGLATFRANNTPTSSSDIAIVSAVSGTSTTIDLAGHFTDPDVTNSVVTFNISKNGVTQKVHMILFDTTKPQTVANFFDYIKSGAYNSSFFHRETNTGTDGIAVLQAGGATITNGVGPAIIGGVLAPIPDELGGTNTNTNGTIAMANTGSANTATNQFYFNTGNNTTLDSKFTVFGKAADPLSQAILDSLGSTPTQDLSVNTANISSATEAGSTVTVTTSTAHKFAVGEIVTIANAAVAGYNGNFAITSTPTPTTFTYTNPTLGLANAGTAGTAKAGPTFSENNPSLLNNEVPLTGGAVTDFPTDASKYLVINSITIDKQDEFLSYSVSINNPIAQPDLVTKSLTNEMLKLNFKSGVTGTATVTVTATDRFGATVSRTFTVTVVVPNHAPVGANGSVTTLENNPYTFQTTDFGFTDNPADAPPNTLNAVKITSLPGLGTIKNDGTAVTAGQLISVADITAGKLVYTPTTNQSGTPFTNFTFQVQDNGGTANGGNDTDPAAKTMTINVTHVNQTPAGTDNTLGTGLNTALTLTTADFGFTDPNDPVANSLQAVKITTLPGAGTLTNNLVPVVAGDFISVTDITSGNLVFTPGTGESGTPYASFTFQVQDNGGTANGAVDTDATPNTIAINVS